MGFINELHGNYWLAQCDGVFFFNRTDCCFSPDDKILVTGTSVKKGGGSGKLFFFDRGTFQKLYEIEVTDAVFILIFFYPLFKIRMKSYSFDFSPYTGTNLLPLL